ncbi:heme-binding protein 2-like [Hypomesus transpacificus]|uniref:heme-binding protein 2-like n=1 Tax=Hypomesus transpacificus TaxID=137520 RepID=UPI001F0741A1|nr:heme-binding protein 2-like [Hypomesus transpacificus]
MVFLAGLAGLLLVLTVEAKIGNSDQPTSFCTETKECLLYDLVCEGDGYEVRHYEPAKWVTTEQKSYIMEVAMATAFGRLFKYITGSNEAGLKIEMTGPVIFKTEDTGNMWEPTTYTMSFLLPSAHQSAPPKPTDETVFFTDMPDMKVYVRSYGGWMLFVSDKLHSHLLSTKLDNVGATYDKNYHYAVGYDSPRKMLNRHNEVWYVAEGEPVCSSPETIPSP